MATSSENDATLQDFGLPASLVHERETMSAPAQDDRPDGARRHRKLFWLAVKIAVSVGGLYLVYGHAVGRDGWAS